MRTRYLQQLLHQLGINMTLGDAQDQEVPKVYFPHRQLYGRFFPQEPPARSTVEVKGLPRGALVEIEITACCA
jgi:enamine deaminase RidA (YjgF/YER057c/UK114 family)